MFTDIAAGNYRGVAHARSIQTCDINVDIYKLKELFLDIQKNI